MNQYTPLSNEQIQALAPSASEIERIASAIDAAPSVLESLETETEQA